jgi:hypothetical protein
MGFDNTALDVAGAALAADVTRVGIATGTPGAGGTANDSGVARQTITWGAISNGGDFANTNIINFTGGPASGAAAYATFWTAGGLYRGYKAIAGATAFNALGEFRIAAGGITVTGTSTA